MYVPPPGFASLESSSCRRSYCRDGRPASHTARGTGQLTRDLAERLRRAASRSSGRLPSVGNVIGTSDVDGAEPLPALDGVVHRFVDVRDDVTIHVAEAGPSGGPAVTLVHGFPQNWWEWHELIGPLAADGYRVLCPDLRGVGWSFGAQRPVFQVRFGRRPGRGVGPARYRCGAAGSWPIRKLPHRCAGSNVAWEAKIR